MQKPDWVERLLLLKSIAFLGAVAGLWISPWVVVVCLLVFVLSFSSALLISVYEVAAEGVAAIAQKWRQRQGKSPDA